MAKEAVYVGLVPNMSALAFWVQEDKKIMTTNQVQFNEHEFPFRKRKMVEQHLSDNSTDMLFQQAFDVIWLPYNKLHVSNYRKVHHDKMNHPSNMEQVSGRKQVSGRLLSYLGSVIRKTILSMLTLQE
jgi:hypothetical protein